MLARSLEEEAFMDEELEEEVAEKDEAASGEGVSVCSRKAANHSFLSCIDSLFISFASVSSAVGGVSSGEEEGDVEVVVDDESVG